MHKKFQNEVKVSLKKKMKKVNEKLEPQFKLSKIDLEDIVNSSSVNGSRDGTVSGYEDVRQNYSAYSYSGEKSRDRGGSNTGIKESNLIY